MCGLCGVVTHGGDASSMESTVEAMTALMVRRGPDDAGFWSTESAAFGFRRLSIMDLSPRGHQPMVTEDGGGVIMFNGELYNHRELRTELERAGDRFRSSSDTEVALLAMRRWGSRALERFNGMFALAYFDTEQRELLLARDPMGIKPLFYLADPRGIVFGSQYDQVVRHPWCNRSRVRMDAVGLYLRLNYMPAPYGVIESTHQLEPGAYLSLRVGGEPIVRRFYDLPEPKAVFASTQDAIGTLEATLDEAVRRQEMSDVRLGTFLSGGIDSPLITAMMQSHHADGVEAFSIGSDDAVVDESEDATAYARSIGCAHHLKKFTASDAVSLVDDVAQAYPDPFADYSSFPTLLVSEFAREHVTVALSGDGGDELFWGYPRFQKVLRNRAYFKAPRSARYAIYGATKATPSRRPARGVLFPTLGDWYLDAHSGLRDPELGGMNPALLRVPGDFDLYELDTVPTGDELAFWMRRNELLGHLQMILAKVDRASMFHSLEVRVPLLDLEVVSVAFGISPSACLGEGRGKVVLREILKRRVPPSIVTNDKKGFTIPLKQWLGAELRPLVEDLLLAGDTFPGEGLDRQELDRLYAAHCDGSADFTRGLWSLLALQLWRNCHLRPLEIRQATTETWQRTVAS